MLKRILMLNRVVFGILFLRALCVANGVVISAEPDAPPQMPLQHTGILTGIKAPYLQVKVGEATWVYKVEAEADKIHYSAEANLAWLRPGLLVRYDGADAKGKITAPLKELFVFSATPDSALGIQDDGDGTYLVAGHLKSFKKGRMTVVVGRRKAIVELAKDAEIHVKYWNLELMQLGDQIQAMGHYFVKGKGIVTSLHVIAQSKLDAPKKKKRRQRRKI